MAKNISPTTTPEQRVAELEHELADLPRLEAEAIAAGDEDTLARLTARARILSRHLAQAHLDVLAARRHPIESELTALGPVLAETANKVNEYEFAAKVYNRAAEEVRTSLAQHRQRVVGLRSTLEDLNREEQVAQAHAAVAGLVAR